jgi:shikimate 5-dehydrogenase
VYQGAAAFELWLGKKAPVEMMLSTAKAAISRL